MDMETTVKITMMGVTFSTVLTSIILSILSYHTLKHRQHKSTKTSNNIRDKRDITVTESSKKANKSEYDFSELDR